MFRSLELDENVSHDHSIPGYVKGLCTVLVSALAGVLIYVLVVSQPQSSQLPQQLKQNLEASGVTNPVTAVLLNFRSFDTLLEVAVLLIVAVAMLPENTHGTKPQRLLVDSVINKEPVLAALLRWLIPIIIVMAGYMLWTGAALPGGAFQAGALLAGAGVLMHLGGHHQFHFNSVGGRWLMNIGLLVFTLVGGAMILVSDTFLAYPPQWAGELILLIETAATVSIAAILMALYFSLVEIKTDNHQAAKEQAL